MSPEKQALLAVWKHKRFWLLQTLAIAAWTVLTVSWFWLPDSRVWGIALATVQGLVVICSGVWLIGSALTFYRNVHAGKGVDLWSIFQESLRRLPALMAVLAPLLWAIARFKDPISFWIIVMLLLPVAAQVSAEGLRGLLRMPWRPRLLIGAIVLGAVGAYLPYKLFVWHPQLTGLATQTVSLALRFAFAYLLAVSAWLSLVSLLAQPD